MPYHDYRTRRLISSGSSSAQGIGGSRTSPTYQAMASSPPSATGQLGSGVAAGVKKGLDAQAAAKATQSAIGLGGALNPPPQVSAFYEAILGSRLRSASSLAEAQRRAASTSLESRGMGQSTELNRVFSDIAGREQQAGQEAQTAVQALKYAQFQSALDFERQKALMKLSDELRKDPKGWMDIFAEVAGPVLGTYLGTLGGGSALEAGTEVESGFRA